MADTGWQQQGIMAWPGGAFSGWKAAKDGDDVTARVSLLQDNSSVQRHVAHVATPGGGPEGR